MGRHASCCIALMLSLAGCGDIPLPPSNGCDSVGSEGRTCDDKDPCTEDDRCHDNLCSGRPMECDVPPTPGCKDSSTLASYTGPGTCLQGKCEYVEWPASCSMGCDEASGACRGDPCTNLGCNRPPTACHKSAGICSSGTCTYHPDVGKACDDGDPCTDADTCGSGGTCSGAPRTCTTPPSNTCKDPSTALAHDKVGTCGGGQCDYRAKQIPCGAAGCDSSRGVCNGDPCAGVTCTTPPGPCYKSSGVCSDGGCAYDHDDGKACDDKNPCTSQDACQQGTCKGTALSCTTPPPSTCKNASTATIHTAPGTCSAGACVYGQADVPCSLGCDPATGKCKGDPCAGIACVTPPGACHRSPGVCSGGSCTYDYDDGKPCNDQNPCTQGDACAKGVCTGAPVSCTTPPPGKCKDSTTATSYQTPGTCSGGACTYKPLDVACPQGCDVATGRCKSDPCAVNPCTTPPNTACFGSPGTCSSISGQAKCTYAPKTGAVCNDGNACTHTDKCSATGTCAGTAYGCSDGLSCTVDACNGAGGCTHAQSAGTCVISGACYAAGALNPGNACQVCDPSKSATAWSAVAGCATPLASWTFDSGLGGWTITPNAYYPTSPVKWQLDSKRADTPTQSLYFGNIVARNYNDPEKSVSGAATSPAVTLPTGQGNLCVQFRLWKLTEADTCYDRLTLTVLPAKTIVFDSWLEPNNAITTPTGGFLTFVKSINAFAGQTIQLKLFFDSVDSTNNTTEGTYVDTVKIIGSCGI